MTLLPLKDVQKALEMFLTVTVGWAVYMLLPFRRQTPGMLLNISRCANDTPKQSYLAQKTTSAADRENRFAVVKWEETECGMDWSLGLVDTKYYIENG